MAPGFFHSWGRTQVDRPAEAGICKRCAGTGYGEEMADLGEACDRGGELPMRKCKSCAGTGAAIGRTAASPFGLMLLIAGTAAFAICPAESRWIVLLSLPGLALLESAWSRSRGRAAGADIQAAYPGPTTEGLLALNDALERDRALVAKGETQHQTSSTAQPQTR